MTIKLSTLCVLLRQQLPSTVRYYCSSQVDDLTLPMARKYWMNASTKQMTRILGRKLHFQDSNPFVDDTDVFAKTCRILGTDTYIPFKQAIMHPNTRRIRKMSGASGEDLIRVSARPLADSVTLNTLETYWDVMAEDKHNEITIGDVQTELLTKLDRQNYGYDLLRLHLTATNVPRSNKRLYFSETGFVETIPVSKQTLDVFSKIVSFSDEASTDAVADQRTGYDKYLTREHQAFRMKMLGVMDVKWRPASFLVFLQRHLDVIQRVVVKKGWVSDDVLGIMREICVILYVMAPHTAHRNWAILNKTQHSELGSLEEQTWPSLEVVEDLKWPYIVQYYNDKGKQLCYAKFSHAVPADRILDEETVTKLCLNDRKYLRLFGTANAEVEDIQWNVNVVDFKVTVKVCLKPNERLDSRLLMLRE